MQTETQGAKSNISDISEKQRLKALKRDGYHCVYQYCDKSSLDIHHVQWISQGGGHNLNNLATLCKDHHYDIHQDNFSAPTVKRAVFIHSILKKLEQHTTRYPKRITRTADPDLKEALKLYSKSFPIEERDSDTDIRRWIHESEILKKYSDWFISQRINMAYLRSSDVPKNKQTSVGMADIVEKFTVLKKLAGRKEDYEQYVRENIQEAEQYIWVHKKKGLVCGYLYYEYDYNYKLAFVDYIVSRNEESTYKILGRCLLNQLKQFHPECRGIIGEVEDPASDKIRDSVRAKARVQHFSRHWGVPIIKGAHYRAPKVNLTEKAVEMTMFLVYYPLMPLKNNILPKCLFKEIIDFIFNSVYGTSFETQKDGKAYKVYLAALKKEVLHDSEYPLKLEIWTD